MLILILVGLLSLASNSSIPPRNQFWGSLFSLSLSTRSAGPHVLHFSHHSEDFTAQNNSLPQRRNSSFYSVSQFFTSFSLFKLSPLHERTKVDIHALVDVPGIPAPAQHLVVVIRPSQLSVLTPPVPTLLLCTLFVLNLFSPPPSFLTSKPLRMHIN